MPTYRTHLPQLDARTFLADGGLETTLVFEDGFDLPDFAAFTLLRDPAGREALRRYYEAYASIAVRDGVGIVLDTPTWRASADWAARLGYDLDELAAAIAGGIELLLDIRTRFESAATPVVLSGVIGPRGDGYQIGLTMTADEAKAYHGLQARAFAAGEVDLVTAVTMTYVDEAIGVTEAARAAGMPVVISFTVETDGTLPSGQLLGEAIEAVDAATGAYPAYFMVNCAHPTHFAHLFADHPSWAARIGGVRANASTMSHEELDEAEELDSGDPADLAARYQELRAALPGLTVLGGCCGTDHRHVGAISAACAAPA